MGILQTDIGVVAQKKVIDHQLIIQSVKEKFGSELKLTVVKRRKVK